MVIDRKCLADIRIVAFITTMSLCLRFLIPMHLLYNGKHDDALMNNMSQSLGFSKLQWTQLSMIKGIGYPLFLKLSLNIGISPVILGHCMYLCAGVFLVWQFRMSIHRAIWIAMIAGIAFNPVLFGTTASRIYRDVLTMSIGLAFCGVALITIDAISSRNAAWTKITASIFAQILLAVALFLVRNDAYWIVLFPPIINFAVITKHRRKTTRSEISYFVFGLLLIVGAPRVAGEINAEINDGQFGIALADDFYHGKFSELLKIWSSVATTDHRKYMTYNSEQREIAYRVSPTLAKLADVIEGPKSADWRSITCQATSGAICEDIAGGYFPWALRDAIENVYRPIDGVEFQTILKKAANEIKLFCMSSTQACGNPGMNILLPATDEIELKSSATYFADYMFTRTLLFRDDIWLNPTPPVDGDSYETVSNWQRLLDRSWGQKSTTKFGTPEYLRDPIRLILSSFGYLLATWSFLGIAGIPFGAKRGLGLYVVMWKSIAFFSISSLYVFLIAIFGANSFGPMIQESSKQMAYLIQPTPFIIIAAGLGWSITLTRLQAMNSDHKIHDDTKSSGVVSELASKINF